jgi:hypothetical protein
MAKEALEGHIKIIKESVEFNVKLKHENGIIYTI